MLPNTFIQRATSDEAPAIAVLVGDLLTEIMRVIGVPAFNYSLIETTNRLREFLETEKYPV